jgi:hypothetical protein
MMKSLDSRLFAIQRYLDGFKRTELMNRIAPISLRYDEKEPDFMFFKSGSFSSYLLN